MDREKYPNYFLAVMILYGIVFLAGLGYFILPSLSFGLAYVDFYLLVALIFLPLVLLAAYAKTGRFLSHLRFVITALTLVDFAIVLYMMILLQ